MSPRVLSLSLPLSETDEVSSDDEWSASPLSPKGLDKAPTGITGFDAITRGGLPAGRPTLLCGGPGCGKTIFAIDYVHIDPTDIEEVGSYNLDGLFVRLDLAVRTVKAKRVVIDSLEVLTDHLEAAVERRQVHAA